MKIEPLPLVYFWIGLLTTYNNKTLYGQRQDKETGLHVLDTCLAWSSSLQKEEEMSARTNQSKSFFRSSWKCRSTCRMENIMASHTLLISVYSVESGACRDLTGRCNGQWWSPTWTKTLLFFRPFDWKRIVHFLRNLAAFPQQTC